MPRRYAILYLILLLSGCADRAMQCGGDVVSDPFELVNRSAFDNSSFVDRLLFRPLAELYRATLPPGIRDRIAGILGNMKEPVVFTNNVLQGEFSRAGTTLERFGVNTTLGVGGMWDFAGEWGLYPQTGDFGQTLAVWGVGAGPYLFVPLFGPSDLRDAVGRGVEFALSPWQYVAYVDGGMNALIDYELASTGTDLVVRREHNIEKIDALRAGSLDAYAQVRSVWLQHRREQICGPSAESFVEIENSK